MVLRVHYHHVCITVAVVIFIIIIIKVHLWDMVESCDFISQITPQNFLFRSVLSTSKNKHLLQILKNGCHSKSFHSFEHICGQTVCIALKHTLHTRHIKLYFSNYLP
jgi:hypothetical protein